MIIYGIVNMPFKEVLMSSKSYWESEIEMLSNKQEYVSESSREFYDIQVALKSAVEQLNYLIENGGTENEI